MVSATPAGVSGPDVRWESRCLSHFPAWLREGYDLFEAPRAAENFVHGMVRQNARHIKPIPHAPGAATPPLAVAGHASTLGPFGRPHPNGLRLWASGSGSIRPLTHNASFCLEKGRGPNKRVKDRFALSAGSDLAGANTAARLTWKCSQHAGHGELAFGRAMDRACNPRHAFPTAECAG